ncbi:HAUS augmin-like complex subunit 4 isoform X2 [Tachypleus tridentatus]|uniref:HAUS augmin-like complex subunit 4 isoform X2 n=1 Tax=Tachypleus tridentatus TaxID=6853 RepID=UPI003FD38640
MAGAGSNGVYNGEKSIYKVNNTLPVYVSQEDLEKFPQFQNFLLKLSNHISPEGTSKQVLQDVQQAEEELKKEKHAYFQDLIVYDIIQELLFNFDISSQKTVLSTEELQIYSDLKNCFINAELTSYLDLRNDSDSSFNKKSSCHILGLTPTLLSVQSPAVVDEIVKNKLVLQIEESVLKKCKAILNFLGQGETSDKFIPAKMSQLAMKLDAQKQTMEESKQKLDVSQEKKDRLVWKDFQTLMESVNVLKKLLTSHRLKSQVDYDSVTGEYLISKCDALLLKAKVVELEVMCGTYTTDCVSALKVIRDQLNKYKKSICKEVSEASMALSAYESVGENFDQLVQEYSYLKAEIENKEWALKEFQNY